MTPTARDNSLNILHIARNPDTGVAAVISSLARAQELRGHDVSILVLKSSVWTPLRLLRELPYQAYWSPTVFGTAAYAYHSVVRGHEGWSKRVLDSDRPLVLHYHNAWLSGAFMFKHPPPGIAQVVTYHGLASQSRLVHQPVRRAIHGHWAKLVERHAEAVVSVDAATPVAAAKLFGVDQQRFVHIPNGSPPIENSDRNGLDKLGQMVVGHVGTVDEGKGWRITAQAVEQARNAGVEAALMVAGGGPEAAQAEAWCKARSYCTYLGWVEDIPRDVLARIDILAMPSQSEGMPMAALEAISVGIPVVCTKVGGLPEVIRDGEEGLLVERTPEAMASAIVQLGSDSDILDKMRQRCRQRWSQHFTDEIMESRYHELYSQFLKPDDAVASQ